jgi:hypothetical protein
MIVGLLGTKMQQYKETKEIGQNFVSCVKE